MINSPNQQMPHFPAVLYACDGELGNKLFTFSLQMKQMNDMTNQLSTNIRKRMSFSRKLALTFFLITLVTFIIIDCIMHVIYEKIITQVDFVGTTNVEAFNQFSNQEVLSSTNAYLYTGIDVYEELISQIYGAYEYFQQNPTIYTSNESRGINPPLTETFTTPRYDRSSVYFYNDNSTFFDQPYVDQSLSSIITSEYPPLLKRVNIYYQDPLNPDNLMIRTVPATNQFTLPNSSVVSQRMATAMEGSIILTNWYEDVLCPNTTEPDSLVALRFLLSDNTTGLNGFHMMMQVQLQKQLLGLALSNVYSFPSTNIILIKTLTQNQTDPDLNTLNYSILAETYAPDPSIKLQEYFTPGHYQIQSGNETILLTTSLPVDDNNQIMGRRLQTSNNNKNLHELTRLDDTIISIIMLNTSQTSQPNIMYVNFLQRQKRTLIEMLYGWTFIILAFTCSIGLVIGHYLFSYFSLILKKCKLYISHPEKIKEIHLQMKKLSSNEKRNRLLMENLIQIMRRIENKKAANRKKPIKETDEYPLNLLNIDFQNRMRLKDGMRFEAIANQLQKNLQAKKRQQEQAQPE